MMQGYKRQIGARSWSITGGPFVVCAFRILLKKNTEKQATGCFASSRDGPPAFHMRDGPPQVTGSSGGTGPPDELSGSTGPPPTKDPPMDWLVRKKTEDTRKSFLQTGKTILIALKEAS